MSWLILWQPLRLPMEPETPPRPGYGPTYLTLARDRFKPLTWPTKAGAQAVLDADTTMASDKAQVASLSSYEAILDARDRAAKKAADASVRD